MFEIPKRANAPTPDEHVHAWVADGTPYWKDKKFLVPKKCTGCPAKQVFDETPANPRPTK